MKKEKRIIPDAMTRLISSTVGVKRFVLIGETDEGKALVMCWNGREYQNQIDLLGLLALGFRAYVGGEENAMEAAQKIFNSLQEESE